ncbi:MAG: type II toxin-antitoxin system Phd/YefM family antitoxin [Candidatus Levyibacteriota bacterium]
MNIPLGNIVSVSDVQRDYRKVFDKAKKTKEPVAVFRDNKPDVTIIDSKVFEEREKRLRELEIEDTLRTIEEGNKEFKEGRTIKAKSLADFI